MNESTRNEVYYFFRACSIGTAVGVLAIGVACFVVAQIVVTDRDSVAFKGTL